MERKSGVDEERVEWRSQRIRCMERGGGAEWVHSRSEVSGVKEDSYKQLEQHCICREASVVSLHHSCAEGGER